MFRKCVSCIIKFLFSVKTVVDSHPIYMSNAGDFEIVDRYC